MAVLQSSLYVENAEVRELVDNILAAHRIAKIDLTHEELQELADDSERRAIYEEDFGEDEIEEDLIDRYERGKPESSIDA